MIRTAPLPSLGMNIHRFEAVDAWAEVGVAIRERAREASASANSHMASSSTSMHSGIVTASATLRWLRSSRCAAIVKPDKATDGVDQKNHAPKLQAWDVQALATFWGERGTQDRGREMGQTASDLTRTTGDRLRVDCATTRTRPPLKNTAIARNPLEVRLRESSGDKVSRRHGRGSGSVDVSEMRSSHMQAKSNGSLGVLPAVDDGTIQHNCLVYNEQRGRITPSDLPWWGRGASFRRTPGCG